MRQAAVNAALSQVGVSYGHGNVAGSNFDCSGLTAWAWGQAGVSLTASSGHYFYGQFQIVKNSGRWVTSTSALQPGDLVFYSNDGGSTCYHVAMYIGGGQVVHAIDYSHGVQVTGVTWCYGFCGGGSPI
jgi:cell wall-associated NlpC family hydrolase